MTETISFPGLGLDIQVSRVAFYIGSNPVYWYGIFIALGLLAGSLYFFSRVKEFAIDPDRSSDVALVTIFMCIVGARLYYVIFSWAEFGDLYSIVNIRQGGLAIYGAIIMAIVSGYLMCRLRKVRFLPAMDLASGSLLLGQAIGRWGNFFNHEAFGSNTELPWGMTSRSISWYLQQNRAALSNIGMSVNPDMPVHPTFLYESLWCLAGFLLLYFFTKKRRFDGQLTLMYLGWYGLGRFFIEGLRTDSLLLGNLKVSQVIALLCFFASVGAMLLIFSKIKREDDPAYLQVYRDTDEGKLVNAGEFYPKKNKKTNDTAVVTGPATDAVAEDDPEPEDNPAEIIAETETEEPQTTEESVPEPEEEKPDGENH